MKLMVRLVDLAARSSPSASGPSRVSRASCTRTIASVRCSSRGVSDVASNGTMLSVKDSDNCTQKTEKWYSVLVNLTPFTQYIDVRLIFFFGILKGRGYYVTLEKQFMVKYFFAESAV